MTAPAPKVFISYRREDAAGHAGRLYDALAARFGDANVFMDVELKPGIDFVEQISAAVGACHVLLAVMGPRWAGPAEAGGPPRIAEPDDFVRLEVRTALHRPDVTVIPCLVGGGRMADPDVLPEDLRDVTRRNALELSDLRWRYDVDRLLGTVEGLLGPPAAAGAPPAAAAAPADARPLLERWRAPAIKLLGVVSVALVAVYLLSPREPARPPARTAAAGVVAIEVAKPGGTVRPSQVTIAKPGRPARFSFRGTAGQRIAPDVRNVRFPGSIKVLDDSVDVPLLNEYGFKGDELMLPASCSFSTGCPLTLAHTGAYTVIVRADPGSTGSLDLRLYGVPADVRAPTRIGGAPIGVSLAIGQGAIVTFPSPRPDTPISLYLTDVGFDGFVSATGPTEDPVMRETEFSKGGPQRFSGPLRLPGTYTIHLRGNQLDAGTLALRLERRG